MSRRKPKVTFVSGTCANCGHPEIEHLPANGLGYYESCRKGVCSCPKGCACQDGGCTCRRKAGSCVAGCECRSECTCPRWRGLGFNPDRDHWEEVIGPDGEPVTVTEKARVYDADGQVVTRTVKRSKRRLVSTEVTS